ncbi:MAG: Rrf2 family transcriptional regulator [Acidimicrobiia bacterium]|nr:Rrf2 family transcriptional regulator [Acidimicrobiia bacterium]MDH3396753.1 Rrf2 family transcriptional regulator [Acidimicrobiia bacterium]
MRLEITRKADLAIRAIQTLRDGVRQKGAELAEVIGTTPQFIAQVMRPLVGQGWVTSEPGPTGGYTLRSGLGDISLLQLIEAMEGPTVDDRCVLRGIPCPPFEPCALHDAWARARNALLDELQGTPLSELQKGVNQ